MITFKFCSPHGNVEIAKFEIIVFYNSLFLRKKGH
jgi:hypothetical protein